ncbi:hypothetical protein LC607_27620 [Nostoc sp. CHAB 5824]|nr:hypothetical protein [Nostoc sp. CHAB 5824]
MAVFATGAISHLGVKSQESADKSLEVKAQLSSSKAQALCFQTLLCPIRWANKF